MLLTICETDPTRKLAAKWAGGSNRFLDTWSGGHMSFVLLSGPLPKEGRYCWVCLFVCFVYAYRCSHLFQLQVWDKMKPQGTQHYVLLQVPGSLANLPFLYPLMFILCVF